MSRIVEPRPHLSATDKALLLVLAEIMTDKPRSAETNLSSHRYALSDEQAAELLSLLEELVESEKFIRSIEFVRTISTSGQESQDVDLRLARLTGKSPIGAGIGLTKIKMRRWRVRLGTLEPMEAIDPAPMTFTHFLKMEERLLKELAIHPSVASLILSAAAQNEDAFRQIVRAVSSTDVRKSFLPSLGKIRDTFINPLKKAQSRDFSQHQLVGLTGLISNASVLFTTRDWGVTGAISSICAYATMTLDHR